MKDIPIPTFDFKDTNYTCPESHEATVFYIDTLVDRLAVDTETYFEDVPGRIVKVIHGAKNNTPFCMTITYKKDGFYHSIYVPQECIPIYKQVLENTKIEKILQNAKFDMHMLRNIGIDIKGKIWDTMIMAHLIDEEMECRTPSGEMKRSKALKDMAYHFLGEDAHEYESAVDDVRRVLALRQECAKSEISYKDVADVAPDVMMRYACADTEYTYQLFEKFYPELVRQELLVAYDVDIAATRAVFESERRGLMLDLAYFRKLEEELGDEMRRCTVEICKLIDPGLNINSAADLVEGFESLGVEWRWYTDKGMQQVNDAVLQGFEAGTPAGELAALVLQYREAAKLRDTFVKQMLEYAQNGRLHPDFNVCPRDDSSGGTVTGRLSSSNPNLHNLPKDDKRIRKGIVPSPGFILMEADFDQQEYRLLAHYAQDRNFSQIIHDGKDVHTGTAEMMLGLPHEEAEKKHNRDIGKRLNFA